MAHRTNIFFTGRDARAWSIFVLRGLVCAFLGAYALALPTPHTAQAVLALGFFWVFDGVSLLGGWASGPFRDVRMVLLRGLICLASGLVLLLTPKMGLIPPRHVVVFTASAAMCLGLLESGSAIMTWHRLEARWAMLFGGLTFLGIGALLWLPMVRPMPWLAYPALGGGLLVLLQGFSLRSKLNR